MAYAAMSVRSANSIDDREVKDILKKIASHTPRFLFRGWSAGSGGSSDLNTIHAITPRAFLGGSGPKSIEDMPAERIKSIWNKHYQGENVDSIFSSWSQCLQIALSIAMSHNIGTESPGVAVGEAYLSIVDTTKLPRHNLAFLTAAPELACRGFIGDVREFLLFGTVTGSNCFRSVSVNKFSEQLLPLMTGYPPQVFVGGPMAGMPGAVHRGKTAGGEISREEVSAAHDIGKLFGDPFALPMACHLLSQRTMPTARNEKFHRTLAQLVTEVRDNASIEYAEEGNGHLRDLDKVSTEQAIWAKFPDVLNAVHLLSAVSRVRKSSMSEEEREEHGGAETSSADQDEGAEEHDEVMADMDEEGCEVDGAEDEAVPMGADGNAATRPPGTEQLTSEQKKLCIDLTGWQNPIELARMPSATRSGKHY